MTPGKIAMLVASLGAAIWSYMAPSTPIEIDPAFDPAVADMVADSAMVADILPPRPASGGQRWHYDRLGDAESIDSDRAYLKCVKYVVAPGDSLWQLQNRFGVRFEAIYALNRAQIDRNFSRRCAEPIGPTAESGGYCSSPEWTLTPGMILVIPTKRIYIAPLPSASVERESSSFM